MTLWNETKSVPVSREMIWAAYKKVRSNQGGAGIDQISMDEYDVNRSKHLRNMYLNNGAQCISSGGCRHPCSKNREN